MVRLMAIITVVEGLEQLVRLPNELTHFPRSLPPLPSPFRLSLTFRAPDADQSRWYDSMSLRENGNG